MLAAARRKIANLLTALTLVAALASAGTARACPGCAEAQAGQGAHRSDIVTGYQLSIIFMMSMPFLLIGSFGGYVYWTIRRARRDQAAQANVSQSTTPTDEPPSAGAAESVDENQLTAAK